MQYDNSNRGAIFKNDDKQQDNHPDYKGSLNVNGVDLWISAWLKTSEKTGKKFLSLSVKPKDAAPVKQPSKPKSSGFDDMDNDVPFN
jgi:uncharacterized protein (DUF736 family)